MKQHKTARGRSIDMTAIAKQHEETRAVSNVPINAKGDIVDSRNKVVKTREEIKKEYYKDGVVGSTREIGIKDDDKPVVTPKPVEEMTQSEILDELAKQSQEVKRTKRTRKDGSEYYEVEYEDGSIEEENIVK